MKWKFFGCMTFSVIAFTMSLQAQNAAPVVSKLMVKTAGVHQLKISFDLADADKDKLKVSMQVMYKKRLYNIPAAEVSGQYGFPVVAGPGKVLTWKCPDSIRDFTDLKIRIIADDQQKVDAKELVDKVNEQHLKDLVKALYGVRCHTTDPGKKKLQDARTFMEDDFKAHGLGVFTQQETINKIDVRNEIGVLPGVYETADNFVVCAHYDTDCSSPGADDNTSGIATVLEVMNALSSYSFSKTIRFVGMDGEEIGHLGSRIYVKIAMAEEQARHHYLRGVFNLDMVGVYSDKPNSQKIPFGYDELYPDAVKKVLGNNSRGDFILNTTNDASKPLSTAFSNNVKRFVPNLKVLQLIALGDWKFTPELNASDHFQFWKENYPAIHIGDTGPNRNAFLDTNKDVIGLLNFHFMGNVARAMVATLVELGGVRHCGVAMAGITAS